MVESAIQRYHERSDALLISLCLISFSLSLKHFLFVL